MAEVLSVTLLQRRWWCSGLKGAVPGRLAEQLEAIQQLHSPFFSDSGTWRREEQVETAGKLTG